MHNCRGGYYPPVYANNMIPFVGAAFGSPSPPMIFPVSRSNSPFDDTRTSKGTQALRRHVLTRCYAPFVYCLSRVLSTILINYIAEKGCSVTLPKPCVRLSVCCATWQLLRRRDCFRGAPRSCRISPSFSAWQAANFSHA